MKTLILLLITITLSLSSLAQKQIKLEEVKDHIGDSVTVGGTIDGIKVFEDDDKKPTLALISLGGDYPKQLLTIAIRPEIYKNTTLVFPDQRVKGDTVTVVGKIELYRGKPQITVRSTQQIVIVASHPLVVPKQ